MKLFRSRLMLAAVVLFTLVLIAVPVLASEGDTSPWDDVVVTFASVTIAWTSVQMGVIRILRGVSISDKPLLDTDAKIWLANGFIGIIGMIIAGAQSGQPILATVLQAALAFFAASGQHEFLSKTGKKSSSELPQDSPSPNDQTGTVTP